MDKILLVPNLENYCCDISGAKNCSAAKMYETIKSRPSLHKFFDFVTSLKVTNEMTANYKKLASHAYKEVREKLKVEYVQ